MLPTAPYWPAYCANSSLFKARSKTDSTLILEIGFSIGNVPEVVERVS
jgi:hypothetical protein